MKAAALLLALLLPGAPARAATAEQALEYGGRRRWWLLHEPQAALKGPRPLVLVLHGGGGSPEGAQRMSDFDALADREGFLVAYPAGTGRLFGRRLLTWNSGNCCGYAMKRDVDDVGFLSALAAKLVAEGKVDPKRVFATGLSNGGMMAHRLGCEASGVFAAVAPVAGALNLLSCRPEKPVSVLMIHGLADTHVPYKGGSGSESFEPRFDAPTEETLARWRAADGCGKDGRCPAGVEVRLITHPGGHIWPGGHPGARYGNVDPVLPEPKASQLIWDFFKAHGR